MRLITFTRTGSTHPEIGARIPNPAGDQILPFADVAKKLGVSGFPGDMRSFLRAGSGPMDQAKSWVATAADHYSLALKRLLTCRPSWMLKSFSAWEKITARTWRSLSARI